MTNLKTIMEETGLEETTGRDNWKSQLEETTRRDSQPEDNTGRDSRKILEETAKIIGRDETKRQAWERQNIQEQGKWQTNATHNEVVEEREEEKERTHQHQAEKVCQHQTEIDQHPTALTLKG